MYVECTGLAASFWLAPVETVLEDLGFPLQYQHKCSSLAYQILDLSCSQTKCLWPQCSGRINEQGFPWLHCIAHM